MTSSDCIDLTYLLSVSAYYQTMSEYKLYYFPVRGKAEAIRLILHYKNIPFEDVRISKEEWPGKKSCNRSNILYLIIVLAFVFGQLPVLMENGKQIAHSWSILRHLGRKFGKLISDIA
jgi:glutathione S-transferase